MRVLFDTNVVLDLLLERPGFADDAGLLFDAHDLGKIEAYISAITPVNVFYISKKFIGADAARQAVYELLATVFVCPFDAQVLQAALKLPISDYEDAAQIAGAIAGRMDAIVTRDPGDYRHSPLPVYTPADLLALLAAD